MIPGPVASKEALEWIKTDPDAFRQMLAHITMGGGLPEWCEAQSVRYSDVMEWIRSDDGRRTRYFAAMADRAEWAKDSIWQEIRKLAVDLGTEKTSDRLKALDMFARMLGMFEADNERKITIEDLVAGSYVVSQESSH